MTETLIRKRFISKSEHRLLPALVLAVLAAGVATLSCAADLTADQVRQLLATADIDRPADLTGKDLSDLDLSNIDFKRANLSGANLFASRLVSSDLAGAKLARANLNGAWLMGTKFAGADLSGSSMLSLVILGGQVKDKPNFAGANLSGVRMIADLPGADLHGARLKGSGRLSGHPRRLTGEALNFERADPEFAELPCRKAPKRAKGRPVSAIGAPTP